MYSISDYKQVPFYDGDRGMRGMNCGVLVNHFRRHVLNKPPAYFGEVSKDDADAINTAFALNIHHFKEGVRHGSIACLFKELRSGDLDLAHVGVLLKLGTGWRVLHISENNGVRLDKPKVFERLGKVKYLYD